MLGALLCVLSIFGPISRVSVNGLHYTAGAIPYRASRPPQSIRTRSCRDGSMRSPSRAGHRPDPSVSPRTTMLTLSGRANEKPYGVFSNLFRRPVEFAGVIYPTAEHWIQAAPTPALAAMAFL